MISKIIKDEKSYNEALGEISRLIDKDPKTGSQEADQLELLSLLVENYENEKFPLTIPDPIRAIKFRMEQQNLSQADLIPYIGSRSKVSEVLSGKRPLSLAMIRALNFGLGIPAEILLKEVNNYPKEEEHIEWGRFPVKELISRGWIKTSLSVTKDNTENLMRNFFAPIGSPTELVALYKMNENIRSARSMDKYALAAWTAKVLIESSKLDVNVKYEPKRINFKFMQEVAKLSYFDDGPKLAQEFLGKHGIALVVEYHLPQTYLDGAAIMINPERPVIGLTLRYDRLDNFWFTLMHELSHIHLHYGQGITNFYDDLDVDENDNPREKEADKLATEALIPADEWKKSPARVTKTPQSVEQFAKKLRINPAIVAGRIRREYKSYNILNNLIGHGLVRNMFDRINGGF